MNQPPVDNDPAHLDPRFASLVQAMLTKAWSEGLHPYIWEGRRTQQRQYRLFGIGRTKQECAQYGVPVEYADPYTVYPIRKNKRTWTLQSKHLTGHAVDIVFDKDSDPKVRVPSWNGNYARLIEIAKGLGIRNLAPIEVCHFEI